MTELQKRSLFYCIEHAQSILNQVVTKATIIGISQEAIQEKLKTSLNFTGNMFNQILNCQSHEFDSQTMLNLNETVIEQPLIPQIHQKLFSKIAFKSKNFNGADDSDKKDFQSINSTHSANLYKCCESNLGKVTNSSSINKQAFPKHSQQLCKKSNKHKFHKIKTEQTYKNCEYQLKTMQDQLRQNKIFTQSIQKRKITINKAKKKAQPQQQYFYAQAINPITYSLSEPKKVKKNKGNFNSINVKAQRSLKIYNFQKSQRKKQRQEERKNFFENYHENYEGAPQQQKIVKRIGLKLKQQEQFLKTRDHSRISDKNGSNKNIRRKNSTDLKSSVKENSISQKKITPTRRLSRADPKAKINLPSVKKPQNKLKLYSFHDRTSKDEKDKEQNQNSHIKLQNKVAYDFLLDKKSDNCQEHSKKRTSKIRMSILPKQNSQNSNKLKLNEHTNYYFDKFLPLNDKENQNLQQAILTQ